MDVKALNEWIETDEGKAWAEALKAPLLSKRDELLSALKDANGKLADQARRAADAEGLLVQERKAAEKLVVDDALAAALKQARVIDAAIPGVAAELREAYGFTVKADGLSRNAVGRAPGDGPEIGIPDAVEAWKATPAAKQLTLVPPSSGGGSSGGSIPTTTEADIAAFRSAMGLK